MIFNFEILLVINMMYNLRLKIPLWFEEVNFHVGQEMLELVTYGHPNRTFIDKYSVMSCDI